MRRGEERRGKEMKEEKRRDERSEKKREEKRREDRSLTEYWLMIWRWNHAEDFVSVLFC